MAQADGCYPRLNAALLQTGKYKSMIVSLVGKLTSSQPSADGTVNFQCCDGATIALSTEHADIPAHIDINDSPFVEVVGQVTDENVVAVRAVVALCFRVLHIVFSLTLSSLFAAFCDPRADPRPGFGGIQQDD
jgi:hypothetical protein